MNVIDLLLIAIFLFSVYKGWLKGFITAMLELLMFAAGIILSFISYPFIASFLEKHFPTLGVAIVPMAFIIALIIIRILLSFIVNRVLTVIPYSILTSNINHVLGVLAGAVNGLIWSTIISALLLIIPFSDSFSARAHNSFFAEKLADKVSGLSQQFSPVFDEVVNKTLPGLTTEPNSDTLIKLPFKTDHPKVRPDLEAKMLTLVNEEREKRGLKALTFDPQLLEVARKHSADMFARGYFSHITPEGLSPFDRMRRAHVIFLAAGENLALGQTLNICHRGLMNSPGHRANILNPAFGRVGIAVLDGGLYRLMITQNFRN